MDFELSPDQITLRNEARVFASERLAPSAAEIDERAEVSPDLLRQAAAFVARAASDLESALVIEEIATASASVAAALVLGAGSSDHPGLRGVSLAQTD